MTIAKIDPTLPIVYGGSAISPEVGGTSAVPGSGNFYYDSSRSKTFSTMDTAFTQNLDGRYLHDRWLPKDPFAAVPGDHVVGASGNQDVVVPYSGAGPNHRHWVDGLYFGYYSTPNASGRVTIEDGLGNVIWGQPVINSGPDSAFFGDGKMGSPNTPMYVRLAAAGSGVVGELSVNHRVL